MTTQLYLQKAEMQLAKGLEEKALEGFLAALDFWDDDIVGKTQARCFVGECFFVHQRYTQAQEQFEWIADRAEWLEQEYDDLLNEEIKKAEMLLGIMERFHLCSK
ncbi:tPR domain protein [Firmicutes bacterium CAG:466]|nr:tPR domain protein [Firmicutes bacterium CAG:466]